MIASGFNISKRAKPEMITGKNSGTMEDKSSVIVQAKVAPCMASFEISAQLHSNPASMRSRNKVKSIPMSSTYNELNKMASDTLSKKTFNLSRYTSVGNIKQNKTSFKVNGGFYHFDYGFCQNENLMEYYGTVYLGFQNLFQKSQLSYLRYFFKGSRNELESLRDLCDKLPIFKKILDEFGFEVDKKSRNDVKRIFRDCSMLCKKFGCLEHYLAMGLLVSRRDEIIEIDSLSKEVVEEIGEGVVTTLRKRWISDIQILALLDVKYIEASLIKMIDNHFFSGQETRFQKLTVRRKEAFQPFFCLFHLDFYFSFDFLYDSNKFFKFILGL